MPSNVSRHLSMVTKLLSTTHHVHYYCVELNVLKKKPGAHVRCMILYLKLWLSDTYAKMPEHTMHVHDAKRTARLFLPPSRRDFPYHPVGVTVLPPNQQDFSQPEAVKTPA
jgi:hypothetical protein